MVQATTLKQVLVIDDLTLPFIMIRGALQGDYEVHYLGKFIHLPKTLKSIQPDLIFLDLKMPGFTGQSMVPIIRKYQAKETPIIIFSSIENAERARICKAIGAKAHLPKSAGLDDILLTVSSVLEN